MGVRDFAAVDGCSGMGALVVVLAGILQKIDGKRSGTVF